MKKIILSLSIFLLLINSNSIAQSPKAIEADIQGLIFGEIPGIYYCQAIGNSFVFGISPTLALRNKIDTHFSDKHPYLTGDEVYNVGYALNIEQRYYLEEAALRSVFFGARETYRKYNLENEFSFYSGGFSTGSVTKDYSSKNICANAIIGYTLDGGFLLEGALMLGVRHISCDYYKINASQTGVNLVNFRATRPTIMIDFRLGLKLGD